MRCLVLLVCLATGSLVDWSTSPWLAAVDFALRAVLNPGGLYGIDKFIDVATHGTGAVVMNVSFLNLSFSVDQNNLTLESVRVGELDSVTALSALEPVRHYSLSSSLVLANLSLAANFTVAPHDWIVAVAESQVLEVDIIALVEAYEDKLTAMKENQVLSSQCWNHTLETLSISSMHTNLSRISALTVAGSSKHFPSKWLDHMLAELVESHWFQVAVEIVLEFGTDIVRAGVNHEMRRVLSNPSAPPCPDPIDRSTVDENRYSAFNLLPYIVGGMVALTIGVSIALSRKPEMESLGMAYRHHRSGMRPVAISFCIFVCLAVQLWSLQVAISTVGVDASVCQGATCTPFPVVEQPIDHFSFPSLTRYLNDSGAWVLAAAMLICFAFVPLGILGCLLIVWWLPIPSKLLCMRRYFIALNCQGVKFCLATLVFQVYMICVLGSNAKLILDDEGSFVSIKIQGHPEIAIYIAIATNYCTLALCHITLHAHDLLWAREDLPLGPCACCCRCRRARLHKSSRPLALIFCMLFCTLAAGGLFVVSFFYDLVTFTTYGLLGVAESGLVHEGYVSHFELLTLATRITELTPASDSKSVILISAVYYLSVVVAPAVTFLLLLVIWLLALRRFVCPPQDTAMEAFGGDSFDPALWTEKLKPWLQWLFIAYSFSALECIVAVTASAASQMHLLFTEVVNERLPFVCTLWSSVSHGECVRLVGDFEVGSWWTACATGVLLFLTVATEHCFLSCSDSLRLTSRASGYLPIETSKW